MYLKILFDSVHRSKFVQPSQPWDQPTCNISSQLEHSVICQFCHLCIECNQKKSGNIPIMEQKKEQHCLKLPNKYA